MHQQIFQAPKLYRFCNNFIDSMVVSIFPILISLSLAPLNTDIDWMGEMVVGMVGSFLYYYLCGLRWGKTIGKVVTRTKVVSKDGTSPTQRQLFIRTLSRIIPFENLTFLFLPVGLHDELSDTRVVVE